MSFLKASSFISLLLFPFLLETAIASDPLSFFCPTTAGNFNASSPYEANLSELLSLLQYKTSFSGFAMGSTTGHKAHRKAHHKAHHKAQQPAYGLALCRGDVPSSDCKTCVADASTQIRNVCPNNNGAVIWYDNCMLKYLNQDFLGQIDTQNKFYMFNVQDIYGNPYLFNQKVKELLNQLSNEASITKKLYGAGQLSLDSTTTLYGLAQCTRDLSSKDCKSCLEEAISDLPSFYYMRQGGRVVAGSCNVRYEIYSFLNS